MAMRNFSLAMLFATLSFSAFAQTEVIPLYPGKAPGSESWNWPERRSEKNMFNTPLVYDVTTPTLTAFMPSGRNVTGTAVVICPGGGFQLLSIESEGNQVAEWLKAHGIAAFVLKYRLMHSETDNPAQEMMDKITGKKVDTSMQSVIKYAIEDGRQAVAWVRAHAEQYHISPEKIGIMGFSAGGTVTMGVTYAHDKASRPDFSAPIYPYIAQLLPVPADAPPLFVVAASDDQLGLAPTSPAVYSDWLKAKKSAELHMYEKGGHGFGMREQNLPTDQWIDRFGDWLDLHGLLIPLNPPAWMKGKTPEQLRKERKEGELRTRNDWGNLGRFAADNAKLEAPKAGEKRVVFMGNSITESWQNADPEFFEGKPYVDRAISGQTSPQNLLRFRQDVINLKPAVVVLMIGINDIAENTGTYHEENTMNHIAAMAEMARANSIRVVLSSVMPAFEFPWRPEMAPAQKVIELNKRIRAYAEKNGFVYLDYHSAMADERQGLPKKYSEDGVHPNLAGYKVMEPLAEKAIAEALKRKP
jgi:acetyl esterase/lipase/lysophospholipase L1-like esterase